LWNFSNTSFFASSSNFTASSSSSQISHSSTIFFIFIILLFFVFCFFLFSSALSLLAFFLLLPFVLLLFVSPIPIFLALVSTAFYTHLDTLSSSLSQSSSQFQDCGEQAITFLKSHSTFALQSHCYVLGLKVKVKRVNPWMGLITRELNGVPSTILFTLYTLLDGLCYYYV